MLYTRTYIWEQVEITSTLEEEETFHRASVIGIELKEWTDY